MNIYTFLFKSLYARISQINKDIPTITTSIFFSILLTFNINCFIYYLFDSFMLLKTKEYNYILFTIILTLNYFIIIKGKKYVINQKENNKKLIIIGYIYSLLSFTLFFMLLKVELYYIIIFLVLFLIMEIIVAFSRI